MMRRVRRRVGRWARLRRGARVAGRERLLDPRDARCLRWVWGRNWDQDCLIDNYRRDTLGCRRKLEALPEGSTVSAVVREPRRAWLTKMGRPTPQFAHFA